MNTNELEDLFIRSFDQPLNENEKEQLLQAMHNNPGQAKDLSSYKNLRDTVLRKAPATFGPYFAQKVITRIQGLRIEIDKQIGFFFKKYQLAVVGVLIAMLAVNVIFADQLNLPSVLGVQDSVASVNSSATGIPDSVSTDEDIVSFDFLESLTNN
jgi:hypothetical protein